MSKIAIVTLYDYYNYGSFLQAFSMQKYCNNKGHDCVFVRTQSAKRKYHRSFRFSGKHDNFHDILKKILLFERDLKKLKQIKIDKLSTQRVNALLIGSDELWNTENDSFSQYPYYYGVGFEDIPTLVYAMSIGNGKTDSFKKKDYIIPAIKRLERIYVRDANTKEAIEKIVEREIEIVCDPTLLLNKSFFDTLPQKKIKQPYILLYSYDLPEYINESIKQYAKDHSFLICSACFRHPIADKHINCTPLEFPSVIKNAALVITSTFHGSLFSVLYNKRLIVLPYAKKTSDFLIMLGLQEVIMDSNCNYNAFCSLADKKISYTTVNKKIEALRNKSIYIMDGFLNQLT